MAIIIPQSISMRIKQGTICKYLTGWIPSIDVFFLEEIIKNITNVIIFINLIEVKHTKMCLIANLTF